MGRQRATEQQEKGKQLPNDYVFSYSKGSKKGSKGGKGKKRGY